MHMVADDLDGEVGRLDIAALEEVRRVMERDGLVDEAGFEDLMDPTHLQVTFSDGIGNAEWARFDIRWRRNGSYSFHGTDSEGRDFRWGFHPKEDAPDKHFHTPRDADRGDPVPSCTEVEEPTLVARAVHKLWRRAYESEDLSVLNTATNPP